MYNIFCTFLCRIGWENNSFLINHGPQWKVLAFSVELFEFALFELIELALFVTALFGVELF